MTGFWPGCGRIKIMQIPRILILLAMMAGVFAFSACSAEEAMDPVAEIAEEEEAQEPERISPHETVSTMLGEASISITYGRPYKKERVIYGGLVPFGEVWRTGADEATTLETDRDLMVGELHVPAGIYSLFTVPGEGEWMLIVNKVAEQWGAFSYDETQDLGRVPMSVSTSEEMTEQLTIGIEAGEGSNGTLRVVWDQTVATAAVLAH